MKHADHDAHRSMRELAESANRQHAMFVLLYQRRPEDVRMEKMSKHVGCSGDCVDQGLCNCSHATAWRAPRQPRKPEPRRPNLPLWTRVKLWAFWSHPRIDWFETILALVALLVLGFLLVGAAVHGLGLLR